MCRPALILVGLCAAHALREQDACQGTLAISGLAQTTYLRGGSSASRKLESVTCSDCYQIHQGQAGSCCAIPGCDHTLCDFCTNPDSSPQSCPPKPPPGEVSIQVTHGSGYSLLSACNDEWGPYDFAQLKLLGKTISFTVELSQVGCACNLAFYLTSAPALDDQGDPSEGTCPDTARFYCDANQVCGGWCPEIDLMEANNMAMQATPHKCDDPSASGHYAACDKNGCGANTKYYLPAYGPNSKIIDTMRPFTVHTTFEGSGEGAAAVLSKMTTHLTQGDQYTELDHSPCGDAYLSKLAAPLAAGMALRISYWGNDSKTMSWLDEPPCGGVAECSGTNAGPATISNVAIVDAKSFNLTAHLAAPRAAPAAV